MLVSGVIIKLTDVVNGYYSRLMRKEVSDIFSKFLKLDSEKQHRIINAAMKEFAQKGYANASTNDIVKEAGISKGLLFHYFKNKKALFWFLYDYTVEVLTNELFMKFDHEEDDIFVRLRQVSKLKIEILKKHPEMYNFVINVYFEEAREVKNELEHRNKELITRNQGKLLEGIDVSKFKEGIDVERAVNVIIWTLEGLASQVQNKAKMLSLKETDFDQLFTEMDIYLDILRSSLYR